MQLKKNFLAKKNCVVKFQNSENPSSSEDSLEGQAEAQIQVKDQGLFAVSFLLSLISSYFFLDPLPINMFVFCMLKILSCPSNLG